MVLKLQLLESSAEQAVRPMTEIHFRLTLDAVACV
jgi:hypothetical protein